MNRQLKKCMQKAWEAPRPDRQEKERFLRALPQQPPISMLQFILIQAAYLRKWTLFLSMLLLFPAFAGAYCIDRNTLWVVSSLIPFLALITVTESNRSMMYGMDEFEMSTPFSLKSVVLARMSILGSLDVFLLCCCTPLCCVNSKIHFFNFFQTGIYLFAPYLLTVNISLWITRHFYGKEVLYACMGATVLVSAANTGLHFMADFVYQISYIKWWLTLSAILIGTMIYETYCTIKQTEELAWNL